MLGRYIGRQMMLTLRGRAGFGGASSAAAFSPNVELDKNATWVKYKSNPKLAVLEGVEDTNFTLRPLDDSEPFAHLINSPFFSNNNIFYTNDPWYHEPDHEAYCSAPERGYITGEDPLESRMLYTNTYWVSIVLVSFALALIGIADPGMTLPEILVFQEKQARDYVIGELEARNERLNELKAREAELLNGGSTAEAEEEE